jgi:HKD family nuclease
MKWIIQHCDLIHNFDLSEDGRRIPLNEHTEVSFIVKSRQSIYEQLTSLVPVEEINEIEVVSPFFDAGGDLLSKLHGDFNNAQIKIFIQEGKTVLPTYPLRLDRIKYFDWNETIRAQKRFKSGQRFNHSKIFVFRSETNTYIFHGSANATSPAFGLHPVLRNDEAALLFHYEGSKGVPDLGLGESNELDIGKIKSASYLPRPENSVKYFKSEIRIYGADKLLSRISMVLSRPLDEEESLSFLDSNGQIITSMLPESNSNEINISVKDYPSLRKAVALYVSRGEEKISRHALINQVAYLWKCDPSRENRKLQKLLSNIQVGEVNEFDILSHLNSILRERNEDRSIKSAALRVSSESATSNSAITYEQAKALEEDDSSDFHALASSKSVWEALNILFRFIQTSKEDNSIDQEEEGFQTDGGEVQEEKERLYLKDKVFSDQKDFDRMKVRILSSFDKYLKYLEYLLDQDDYEVASPDLCYFLVLYYELIYIAGKPYQLKIDKENSDYKVLLPLNGLMKIEDSFNSISIRILGHFILLTNKYRHKEYEDEYSIKEFETYKEQCSVLIYFALTLHASLNRLKPIHRYSLLWLNTEFSLCPFKGDSFEKLMETIIDKINFDLPDDLNELRLSIERDVARIKKDIDHPTSNSMYTQLPFFGTCKIIKKMPLKSPKSIKVSFPGVSYDEIASDFIYPLLYNFEREEFMKSVKK